MKKGLKVLSAVLALSMGMAAAGIVSAEHVNKTTADYIFPPTSGAKGNSLYQPKLTGPAFEAFRAEVEKALKGVSIDAAQWATISSVVCGAIKNLEDIETTLAKQDYLIERASDLHVFDGKSFYKETVKRFNAGVFKPETLKINLVKEHPGLLGEDWAELQTLVEQNALYSTFKAADAKKLVPPSGVFVPVSGLTYAERLNQNYADIKTLIDKVNTVPYKEAVKYLMQWTESNANNTSIKLQAAKTEYNAVVALGRELVKKFGMTLAGCALPPVTEEEISAEADAAKKCSDCDKKDKVPATGISTALGLKQYFYGNVWGYALHDTDMVHFSPRLIPGLCPKKVEKVKPMFTFDCLRKASFVKFVCP